MLCPRTPPGVHFSGVFELDEEEEAPSAPESEHHEDTLSCQVPVRVHTPPLTPPASAYARTLAAPCGELERRLSQRVWLALCHLAPAVPDASGCLSHLLASLLGQGVSAVLVTDTLRSRSPSLFSVLGQAQRHAFISVDTGGTSADDGALLIVDPSFREQFAVARPTAVYTEILQALPCVFVGSASRLSQLVQWLAHKMKDCYAASGMALPPWRTSQALLVKWRLHEDE